MLAGGRGDGSELVVRVDRVSALAGKGTGRQRSRAHRMAASQMQMHT